MGDIKKLLKQYIKNYHKKGYSLGQIKKGLIFYGYEPTYIEKLITEYKLKRVIYIMLFFVIVICVPLLIKPNITGYSFVNFLSRTHYFSYTPIFFSMLIIFSSSYLLLSVFPDLKNKFNSLHSTNTRPYTDRIKKFITKSKGEPTYRFKTPHKNSVERDKIKNISYILMFFIIVASIPLLIHPTTTGYFIVNSSTAVYDFSYSVVIFWIIIIFLSVAILLNLHADSDIRNPIDRLSYHQSMTGGKTNLEKMRGGRASDSDRACPQSEIGGSPEHFDKKSYVNRIKEFIHRLNEKFGKKKPVLNEEEKSEKAEYLERNPVLLLYSILIIVTILTMTLSIIFRKWMIIVFGIGAIISAIIGYCNVRKMAYKGV